MTTKYILDGHLPVKCNDLLEWAEWFGKADRHVAADELPNDIRVSTVFLGLDHAFGFKQAQPILFETMIFGGKHDGYQRRYATWDEAEIGHAKALKIAVLPATPYTFCSDIERCAGLGSCPRDPCCAD